VIEDIRLTDLSPSVIDQVEQNNIWIMAFLRYNNEVIGILEVCSSIPGDLNNFA
jgi:hypothetical protein